MRLHIYLAAALSLSCASPSAIAADTAEWTLMIFMNARNNLERDALANFHEIAAVGSTAKVNVVVELGRPKKSQFKTLDEGWSGVLRFFVQKSQNPVPSVAVADISADPVLSDMGSAASLNDFISWSIQKYPAKKYMLVIWNHGQGWRFQASPDATVRNASSSRAPVVDSSIQTQLKGAIASTQPIGGFRAVSFDEDTGHFLYNSDVQQTIANAIRRLGRKIDVVGFDACLMSMLETAYGLRSSATMMVSSEELEPGAGWDYESIMRSLTTNPAMTPTQLSNAVVSAYKNRYGDENFLTTLSVVDLDKIQMAAKTLSTFAASLRESLGIERANLQRSRSKMTTYGADYGLKTSVDLMSFLSIYGRTTSNVSIRSLANDAQKAAQKTIITNYASAPSSKATGSLGLAIYFPASKADFSSDPYGSGYLKSNTDHPVEFVEKEYWADFLHSYLE